jgi:osmotically-inducible protein OsmY
MTRSRTLARGGLTALLALALAAPVLARDQAPLSDTQIQEQVEHKLAHQRIEGVTVKVHEGHVTLSGSVRSAWAKNEAFKQAMKADDVLGVTSDLTVAEGEGDDVIASAIQTRLRNFVFYSVFDTVNFVVKDGVVTLHGAVTAPYKAQEMAKLASRVQGVQAVKNDIKVLPASSSDDQLRQEIASEIYNDPMFSQYAIQTNPPVHIIVDNGQVTLTGVVQSKVERMKAEIIARNTFGVFDVRNDLRIEG